MLLGLMYALLPIPVAVLLIHSLFLFLQKDHDRKSFPFWVNAYFIISFGFIVGVPVAYADEIYSKIGLGLITRFALGFALAFVVLAVLAFYLNRDIKKRQSYERSL